MQTALNAPITVRKRGRPTKYVPGTSVLLETYLADCVDVYEVAMRRWDVHLPTIEGFARHLGVHRDTLYAWAKKYPEYEDAMGRLMDIQYSRLVNGGLAGHYKVWLVIIMLMRNHRGRLGLMKNQEIHNKERLIVPVLHFGHGSSAKRKLLDLQVGQAGRGPRGLRPPAVLKI